MVNFYLKTFEDVRNITNLCVKYPSDVDVLYGRYIIDGKSYLGVSSLVGHDISLEIITDDIRMKDDFAYEIEQLTKEQV